MYTNSNTFRDCSNSQHAIQIQHLKFGLPYCVVRYLIGAPKKPGNTVAIWIYYNTSTEKHEFREVSRYTYLKVILDRNRCRVHGCRGSGVRWDATCSGSSRGGPKRLFCIFRCAHNILIVCTSRAVGRTGLAHAEKRSREIKDIYENPKTNTIQ